MDLAKEIGELERMDTEEQELGGGDNRKYGTKKKGRISNKEKE